MNRLGIEMLTLLGMPPVEYVKLAAELGCAEVSTGLTGLPLSMFGLEDKFYPQWSLRDDPALRREMKAAMADTGVRIGLAEGYSARSGHSVREFEADLDLMAELGALRLNAICMEDDLAMARDELALLAGMATERDMVFTIEFFPPRGITCLEEALGIIAHIGPGKCRVLLDTMHFCQTGGTVAQLEALAPGTIGYVQLADSRANVPEAEYMNVAMFERRVPGEGELPLREVIAALPRDVTISVEAPNLAALRGIGPHEHAARCVAAARALGV